MNTKPARHAPLRVTTLTAFGAAAVLPLVGFAQTLSFPSTPLYVQQSVQPNLLVSIDNSGSTDWEVSFSSNGGEAWWNPGNTITGCTTVGFAGCGSSGGSDTAQAGVLNFNTKASSGMYDYDYLFPNGSRSTATNLGGRFYPDDGTGGTSGFYAIPPVKQFAWARDVTYNGMYYDPTQTYNAWPSNGTTTYSDATATAVLTDTSTTSTTVTTSNTSYFDLTKDTASNSTTSVAHPTDASTASSTCTNITTAGVSQWGFRVYSGMVLETGQVDSSGTTMGVCYKTSTASGAWTYLSTAKTVGSGSGQLNISGSTIWIRYFPATFYVAHCTDLSAYGYNKPDDSCSSSNTSPTNLTGLAPDGTTILDGYQIILSNFVATSDSNDVSGVAHTQTENYNRAIQNFANWFQYYRKRYLAIRGGLGAAFDGVSGMNTGFFTIDDSNGNPWGNSGTNLTMLNMSTSSGRTSFFDSSYGYARGAFGTPNREAVEYMGKQLRNNSSIITAKCQKNFTMLFTDGYSNAMPGDETSIADSSGDGVTGTFGALGGAPYKESSAVSYTMADRTMYDYYYPLKAKSTTFPYGYVNPDSGCTCKSSNVASNGSCTANADGSPNYTIPNSALDCNTNLHANFYGVILNSNGFVFDNTSASVFDPSHSTTQDSTNGDPYTYPPTSSTYPPTSATLPDWAWPSSSSLQVNYSPAAVDDMWHAAVNSRGLMINAHNTTEIQTAFEDILANIALRSSSAAAVAINSSTLDTTTQAFQATFNTSDWSGGLIDYPVSDGLGSQSQCISGGTNLAAGAICSAAWDAATVTLKAASTSGGFNYSGRTVLTFDTSSRTGIPFEYNNLNSTQKNLLANTGDSTTASPSYAELRLRWLRGDNSHESSSSSPRFRKRSSTVLGDIIDSSPFFVSTPSYAYSFNNYSTFRQRNYDRTPMVYVGANDGMLHAFQATTSGSGQGKELMAFVPSKAFGTCPSSGTCNASTSTTNAIAKLTSTAYTHQYSVDGSPNVGDAYFGGDWHSVLAGTMGFGGKEVFALDVTTPTATDVSNNGSGHAFAESNASSLALWEFTDSDNSDLGYTFSQASIVPTRAKDASGNNRFAVILGNGYNSSTGKAALFILFLDHTTGSAWSSGTDYIEIPVPADSFTGSNAANGLSTPAVVDLDGDGIADRVYAGDLHGNMWRFDLSSSSTSDWTSSSSVTKIWSGQATSTGAPSQPITEQPQVGNNLNSGFSGYIVYFGTGRYLDTSDNTINPTPPTQNFYGIFDTCPLTGGSAACSTGFPIASSSLVSQSVNGTASSNGVTYFTTTSNPLSVSSKGWAFSLDMSAYASGSMSFVGQRVITNPVLRNGRIIFTTLIPGQTDCAFGASVLFELNAQTGASPGTPVFDVNQNGTVDTDDKTGTTYPSGQYSSSIESSPTVLQTTLTQEEKLMSTAGGNIATVTESAAGRQGRITWREVLPNQ